VLVKKGERDKVETTVVLFEKLKAPMEAGDQVGEVIAMKDGIEVGRYPLVADADIKIAGLHEIYIRMLRTLL